MKKFNIFHNNWSLYYKPLRDVVRHREKIRKAIKNNLPELIAVEEITVQNGNKTITIPFQYLKEYRLIFDRNKGQFAGQGDGKIKRGDSLDLQESLNDNDRHISKGPGFSPGIDRYEEPISLEELQDIVFGDLKLPEIQKNRNGEINSSKIYYKDTRKTGISINKKQTLLENLKKNAIQGNPCIGNFSPEDLIFKSRKEEKKPDPTAVVFAILDTSGSMGSHEKYISRVFFLWTIKFLVSKYKNIELKYLVHDAYAHIVNEEQFYRRSESGGTRYSPVYELALELIEKEYDPKDQHIYAFHLTDGDNLPSDHEKSLTLAQKMVDKCDFFAYGEVTNPYYKSYTLLKTFQEKISSPQFVAFTIRDRNEIANALRIIFGRN